MKRIIILSIVIVFVVVGGVLLFKELTKPKDEPVKDTHLTQEKVLAGVNKYCHEKYDWSIAEENPEIMYVTMGEETEDEYLVIFRSYTGALINFHVNKKDGVTKIVEVAPNVDQENDLGTIDIDDYL